MVQTEEYRNIEQKRADHIFRTIVAPKLSAEQFKLLFLRHHRTEKVDGALQPRVDYIAMLEEARQILEDPSTE